jgi:uncharacterized damage-inducible protein DinB
VSVPVEGLEHHAWANDLLLGICEQLTDDQLARPVAGTYGSVLDTCRHLVGSDTWYLWVISRGEEGSDHGDEDERSIAGLREMAEGNAAAFGRLLAGGLDDGADIAVPQPDGSRSHVNVGIRLAQVVHHGTDHRSQICTALTELGIDPLPEIDVWAWAEATGAFRLDPPDA